MKVVLVMYKDDERREFAMRGEKMVIGRRQDCDLRVPTLDVSRQHCELSVQNGALMVRDLGSSNGTYINRQRISESKLGAGDLLGVGPVIFKVQIDGRPASITPHDFSVPAAAVPATVLDDDEDEDVLDLDEAEGDIMDGIDVLFEEDDEDDDETRV